MANGEKLEAVTDFRASLVAQTIRSLCNAGDAGSIPGSGRSPGEGNGNPLQYSCLENSMDRGARQATVHGVARVRHDLVSRPLPLSRQTLGPVYLNSSPNSITSQLCDLEQVVNVSGLPFSNVN